MARFSQGLFNALASPSYGRGLMAVGAQLGSAQAMAQAAERQKEIDSMSFKLLRQGLFSADQGDVSALAARTNDLVDMMGRTTDEKSRATLQDMITQLDAQRSATQTRATSNTAASIIKTEQALMDLQNEMDSTAGPLAPERQKVFDALTQRLEFMKQNAKAVVEADDIKYEQKFQAAKKQNALAEQQRQIAKRSLSAVPFGSDAYKDKANELRKAGFGQAVDQYETTQYQLIESRDKAEQILLSKEPLTKDEMQTLVDNGFEVVANQTPLTIKRDRKRLATISQANDMRTIEMANRVTGEVANVRNHVVATLETLRDSGDLPFNLFDDLYNKIDDLLKDSVAVDQISGLLERPKGQQLSSAEVRDGVISIIKSKYPEQFKDAQTYQDAQIKQSQRLEFLTLDLMAEAGLADRNDDGTITVKEGVKEEDIRRFRAEAERRTSITGTIIRSITSPKTDTAIGDIDVYSPGF